MKGYQFVRFGEGFEKRRLLRRFPTWPLRRRLRNHAKPPFTLRVFAADGSGEAHPQGPYPRRKAVREARLILERRDIGARVVIDGSGKGDSSYAVRSAEILPKVHPFIRRGVTWIGRSAYQLFMSGPPPRPCDCSGYIMRIVFNITGISLPHQANLMQHDPRIQFFTDPSLVQQGDLCFWHYDSSPRPSGEASHVEFVDIPHVRHLGSRPSTNGVGYFDPRDTGGGRILGFGRVRTTKPLV